jgi:hypothetical protein
VGELPARERATTERALRRMVRGDAGLAVLTGGQTGVDTMAAVAALRAGLPVHLVFPRGFRQEDGRLSMARRAELVGAAMYQLASPEFAYRTWTCAYLADAVILVDPAGGVGCRETARAARSLGRPLLALGLHSPASPDQVMNWLVQADARLLMIAGCRASLLAAASSRPQAKGLVGAVIVAAGRRSHELADRALPVAAQQCLGSHRDKASRQEGSHTGGIGRRHLSPERLTCRREIPGRPCQQPPEAAPAVTRVHLDGDLQAPGHAPAEDYDAAVRVPGPDVQAEGVRPRDPRVGEVGVRCQVSRRPAGQRLGRAQHVDAVRATAGRLAQRRQERRAERRGQIAWRQLRHHPARLDIGEDHGVRGEADDAAVPRRWLRQHGHAAVGGRKMPGGRIPEQPVQGAADRTVGHR